MDNSIVSVRHLSHRYSVQWAVRDVSFEIARNGVTGLLGSNGAGKSTIMNIICGVLNQTCGEVFINGVNLLSDPIAAKRHLGFLPQKPPVYPDMTVQEYLTHCAYLRMMDSAAVKRGVQVALEKCAITDYAHRLIRNLSGGYQQRVGIAQSLVHNPAFVVMDEPTNGLDPNQIVDIRNLIKSLSAQHCILLSSHILSEVHAICDDIRMIENGQLVFSGTMDEFDNYVEPRSFVMECSPEITPDEIIHTLQIPHDEITQLAPGCFSIAMNGSDLGVTERILAVGYDHQWHITRMQVDRCSLDEIFAQISGKKTKQMENA